MVSTTNDLQAAFRGIRIELEIASLKEVEATIFYEDSPILSLAQGNNEFYLAWDVNVSRLAWFHAVEAHVGSIPDDTPVDFTRKHSFSLSSLHSQPYGTIKQHLEEVTYCRIATSQFTAIWSKEETNKGLITYHQQAEPSLLRSLIDLHDHTAIQPLPEPAVVMAEKLLGL